MFDNILHSTMANLRESVIDIPRDSLDSTVFQFSEAGYPTMHRAIKIQIIEGVKQIEPLAPITDFYVIGSILTPQYNSKSDIDVNVQIDDQDLDNIATESMLLLLRKLNGQMAIGTTHKINYFIIRDEYNLDNTEAAYDVVNERWIKEPASPTGIKAKAYVEKFATRVNEFNLMTDELRRDLIDFSELSSFQIGEVRELKKLMDGKLNEIEDDITELIGEYKETATLRRMAFDREMTPAQIKQYGSKNKLPENVIYKMLEKYYYWDFIGKLRDIISDGKVTPDEIQDISRAGSGMWT